MTSCLENGNLQLDFVVVSSGILISDFTGVYFHQGKGVFLGNLLFSVYEI